MAKIVIGTTNPGKIREVASILSPLGHELNPASLELMNEKVEDVLSFGDRAIDMIASKRAGIKAIACLWGTKERSMLLGTAYDQAISSPLEILPYLQ